MTEKKILFSDLDGTLLKNDKSVSAGNRMAIKNMLNEGHYFVIASGRPVAAAVHIAEEIGLMLHGCYMITYNGSVIYDCKDGAHLMEKTIPFQEVEYLFQEAKKYGLHIQTYQDNHVLTAKKTAEIVYYAKNTTLEYKLVDSVMDALTKEPNKVLIASLTEKEKLLQFQKDHMEWQQDKCNSFFSCDEYLEYCPYGTSKGAAMKYLVEYLNIPMKNTFAVGDELNDIPMLLTAEKGVAMGNAKSEVKKAADYVLAYDNEHDGVGKLIEQFILMEP